MNSSPTPAQANLYPIPTSTTNPPLAVCLSGGGSRALTCALGQLSGLRSLPNPANPSETLLDAVTHLSSVSGGSWASVLFTFLPSTINGTPVSDDDFLIQPVAPAQLIKGQPANSTAGNVSYLAPYCLGTVPQRFDLGTIAKFLYTLYQWGFLSDPAKRPWFWIAGVGELVLKPFGLYDTTYNSAVPQIEPTMFFSLSADQVNESILPQNPTLQLSDFYTCRTNRPSLFVNANLLENKEAPHSRQIPFQATPIYTSVPGSSPDGTLVGGGGVESFAYTSTLTGAGSAAGTAAVSLNRRFSLCDIAGCSSAFFAGVLLRFLDREIDNVVKELGLSDCEAKLLKSLLEPILNEDAAEFIPTYNYWSVGAVNDRPPKNSTLGFSDGGDFDNTGILGLLAQTDATRILSFLNVETPISKNSDTGTIVVDPLLPLLFGHQQKPVDGIYHRMTPEDPLYYVGIFSDANGEFAAACAGLYEASCGGPGQDSQLGTHPAAFTQCVTTVENPVANIRANRNVTVLWVYNSRVNQWQQSIQDPGLLSDLKQGQSNQNPNGTLIQENSSGTGPLANFPYYFTGEQIYLPPEAVNLLAQLSAWNVQQLAGAITKLMQAP